MDSDHVLDGSHAERQSQQAVARLPLFQHEPIDHERDSIRLIEVLPGPDESDIQCRMRHANISEATYKCLSYTWLPRLPMHDIEINGCLMTVGDNLYQFLLAFRAFQRKQDSGLPQHELKPSTWIWIDAISIDQANTLERNHQVQQMGAIYKNAEQVLIWLGKLDSDMLWFLGEVDALVESGFLHELAELAFTDPEEMGPDDQKYRHRRYLKESVSKKLGEWNSLEDLLPRQYSRFHTLPYWSRIWIAQEILLPEIDRAHSVVIFPGQRLINISDLSRSLVALFCGYIAADHVCCKRLVPLDAMFIKYGDWISDNVHNVFPNTLAALLWSFKACQCLDIRDRVFALLSLVSENPPIAVDYDRDVISLFQHVLEQSMDGGPLDQLLGLGAVLLNALELRPPPQEILRQGPAQVKINMAHAPRDVTPVSVGHPVWSNATLEVLRFADTEDIPRLTILVMPCMYVPIFDGVNTHVLEFTVRESDSTVIVDFCRCHEYVRGHQSNDTSIDRLDYHWCCMPSEDVYYLDTGVEGRYGSKLERLNAWKAQNVEQLCNLPKENEQGGPPRLEPSRRFWMYEEVSFSRQVDFGIFPAAYNVIQQDIVSHGRNIKLPDIQQGRGTIVRPSGLRKPSPTEFESAHKSNSDDCTSTSSVET